MKHPSLTRLRRWLVDLAVVLLVVAALGLWRERGMASGEAPPLPGPTVAGAPFELHDGEGPTLVYFWGSWCPICRFTSPTVAAIARGNACPDTHPTLAVTTCVCQANTVTPISRADIMPKPRKALVSLEATPYYHCVSRCVRRAFLCGKDDHSGQSFEHRRQWIADKMKSLAEVFALDVCAYAVMSNHYHAVLHIDQEQAGTWDTAEVIRRWQKLFAGHLLTQRFLAGESMSAAERDVVGELAELWRARLTDISWYMRCLNEAIAREANKEDNCTGRFWEGRFKSQALLDEKALAACLAYVDLNPVRAGIAETPETSEYTSIKERVAAALSSGDDDDLQPSHLLPFVGNPRENIPKGLPFPKKGDATRF